MQHQPANLPQQYQQYQRPVVTPAEQGPELCSAQQAQLAAALLQRQAPEAAAATALLHCWHHQVAAPTTLAQRRAAASGAGGEGCMDLDPPPPLPKSTEHADDAVGRTQDLSFLFNRRNMAL